jgi:hypothetical protein
VQLLWFKSIVGIMRVKSASVYKCGFNPVLVPPCPRSPWQLAQLASKIFLPTSASPPLDDELELEDALEFGVEDELELDDELVGPASTHAIKDSVAKRLIANEEKNRVLSWRLQYQNKVNKFSEPKERPSSSKARVLSNLSLR